MIITENPGDGDLFKRNKTRLICRDISAAIQIARDQLPWQGNDMVKQWAMFEDAMKGAEPFTYTNMFPHTVRIEPIYRGVNSSQPSV